MLGAGIDRDIGAEPDRLLQDRGGEDVIDDDPGTGLSGDGDDGRDIDDLKRRVGRGFEEEHLGVRLDRIFPLADVGAVDQRRLDAVFREDFGQDVMAGAKQGASRDHVISALELADQGGPDRRHAACRGETGLRILQQRHPVFEHLDRRVAVAGVDEAVFLAIEAGLGRFRTVIDIAGGEEQGF